MSEPWSMPWAAPVFPQPPHSWKGVQEVVLTFEVDSAELAAVLPPPLEPAEGLGILTMLTYPWGSAQRIHPFNEAVVMVPARLGELVGNFVPYIYVTTDEALIAGREAAGWPKKLADITWERDGDAFRGSVTRWGTTIIEVTGDLSSQPDPDDTRLAALMAGGQRPTLNYKLIPGPGLEIEVEEITSSQLEIVPSEIAVGSGRISSASSEDDPVGSLLTAGEGPMVAMVSDNTIPVGEVVHRIDRRVTTGC